MEGISVLYFLSLGSYVFFFLLFVLCLASGLYYLAEFVEEYIIFTKKVITRTLQCVIFIHVLLVFFDTLPLAYVLLGLTAHFLYYLLLSKFPFFDFADPLFLACCGMAIIDHCAWFVYFSRNYYPFSQILAFFTICVWLIPFGFFISLSANESVLPGSLGASIDDSLDHITEAKKKKSFNVLVSAFNFMKNKTSGVLPSSSLGPSNFEKLT